MLRQTATNVDIFLLLHAPQVAVKLLPLGISTTGRQALPHKVAQLLRRSSHVVKVLGLAVKGDKLAIVMEECARNLTAHIGGEIKRPMCACCAARTHRYVKAFA